MKHESRLTMVRYVEGQSGESRWFDLEATESLTGVHRDMIMEFAKADLIPSARVSDEDADWTFDERAIYRLRQIDALLRRHHTSLRVIRDILHLLDRLEEADLEIQQLREMLR